MMLVNKLKSKWLILIFIGLCYAHSSYSEYIITTSRRWTSESNAQVCLSLSYDESEAKAMNQELLLSIKTKDLDIEKSLMFGSNKAVDCAWIYLPKTTSTSGQISISGSIDEHKINYTQPIAISTDVIQTFVQTDKYLYKPSQTVKFRILTAVGTYLKVSTDPYNEIYIENPSGTRIGQWLNVSNVNGLIHKEFQLSDEPGEGIFSINVLSPDKKLIKTNFKVEDYVLPRFEVTIKEPNYVLGNTKLLTYKVCAKYTFGQPVKGKVTFTIDNGIWNNMKTVTRVDDISGCTTFNITSEEIDMKHQPHKLNANALVSEQGTEVEIEAISKIYISRTALTFEDISTQKFYKPESVFVGKLKVTFPDGSPAQNELMNVCVQNTCKNFTTNNNGILKFGVPPHLQYRYIQVEAVNYGYEKGVGPLSWKNIMIMSSNRMHVYKYHSPSNSSLKIELDEDKVKCIPGEEIQFSFPISFTSVGIDSRRVSVQVISRGDIIFVSNDVTEFRADSSFGVNSDLLVAPLQESVTENLIRGSFIKTVKLLPFASPKAKLIVFYSRPDGEVVSDTKTVDITECLYNHVNLTWSVEKAQPGEEAVLSISSEPESLCSLGVVDKSVQLLSAKNTELTISKLLEVANRASVKDNENIMTNDDVYCKDHKDKDEIGVPPPFVNNRVKRWGARSLTSRFHSIDIDALHMFDEAGLYVFSDMQLESRLCIKRKNRWSGWGRWRSGGSNQRVGFSRPNSPGTLNSPAITSFSSNKKIRKDTKSKGNDPRTYLPETWLWQIYTIEDTGISKINLTLPDTITEWVGSAVCVHPTKGIGISEATSIITFSDFFTDLTLPAVVKRGETFPVKISVFNYLKESLPIRIILETSPEYDILDDEGSELGSGERSSCIPKEDKIVQSVRIKPKAVGDINITVTAFVDINSIDTCGTGTNKNRTDTLIKPVKVQIEGFEKEKVWTEYVCEGKNEKHWSINAPRNIIPDSERGFISVVGNQMGPTIENLGKLVKMPYGCGEQNMLNFAPNIFVMPYLNKNETRDLAEKAIEFMQKGYQRELNYRHKDGSYSAFGESDDSGSTWLTAFVLKSFAQARNYISIDSQDLSKSQDWLKHKQLKNGCFESVGKVLHKGMKGGISKTNSSSLLSSFVLIALLEAGEDPTGKVVNDTLLCLNADKITTEPYAVAVKSYALALANSQESEAILQQNLNNADQSSPSSSSPISLGSSVEVETAGYVVLSLLTSDPVKHFPTASRIVKWMNKKRNGQGGFVSTQDTIVALQAIAKFDELTNKGPVDIDVIVDMSSQNSMLTQEEVFRINNSNDLLQQKVSMPFVPLDVKFILDGQGCVLLQGVLRYNEPEPEASEAFKLSVTTASEANRSCNTKNVKACVSYLLPDLESNMGIIEVTLVSGYIPLKDDLKKVISNDTGLFKRYEVDGNVVTFYVDQFSTDEVCVSFGIKQEVEVENPKPGLVKVYDYYKPEYYVTEKYTLPTECKKPDPGKPLLNVDDDALPPVDT